MPKTYDLHLTFGQMETLKALLEKETDQITRILNSKDTHETVRPQYQLELERLQGILEQF